MNKTRRRSIQQIIDHLTELKEHIDLLRDEEQEAYDNLPESLQESERGEAMSTAIYQMIKTLNLCLLTAFHQVVIHNSG